MAKAVPVHHSLKTSTLGEAAQEAGLSPALPYPFAAITGHRLPKLALTLLAVDPSLKGLLISAGPGVGKTTLARSFAGILPVQPAPYPYVEVPANVTEDRLLGGLDVEQTLASGVRCLSPGLLAQADGGLVYIDGLSLVAPAAQARIAAALDSGLVRIEREGLSHIAPARFILIATYDGAEGEVGLSLADRVGLMVSATPEGKAEDRAEIATRVDQYIRDPQRFLHRYAAQTSSIRRQIEQGRINLPGVEIDRASRMQLSKIARTLEVEGNRADLFAVRAAKASAALAGRTAVDDVDLATAVQLVLIPRGQASPAHESDPRPQAGPPEGRNPAETAQPEHSEKAGRAAKRPESRGQPDIGSLDQPSRIAQLVVGSTLAALPDDAARAKSKPRGRVASHHRGSRRRASKSPATHGRYVGSEPKNARVTRTATKIALDATLRAAAPFQKSRRAALVQRVQEEVQANARPGRVPEYDPRSVADGTVYPPKPSNRVIIKPCDLHVKKLQRRSGMLFVFVVDASGSMAAGRMGQAKGAMIKLLRKSYLNRDSVALVAFAGDSAKVLLGPARSVTLARRLVEGMPAGGGTPLAAGLISAVKLIQLARKRLSGQAMLVILTDGSANVALNPASQTGGLGRDARDAAIRSELDLIGRLLAVNDIASVLIDTGSRFVLNSKCRDVAAILRARYVYLPHFEAGSVFEAIRQPAANQSRDRQ
ncbi:MAG TPA: VWA domain-containing protein [Blastocatellia bacterium]|nr:VWA domain-containing protein [Blastocatellia bacterium]